MLFLGDGLVEAQENPREDGVGRKLRGRGALRNIFRGRLSFASRNLARIQPAVGHSLALFVNERTQLLAFIIAWLASERSAKGVGNPIVIGRAAVLQRVAGQRLGA